jgi:hypothetical protein
VEPSGLGVRWMAQAVPFHRSASSTGEPLLASEYPTAVQAEADVHDTAEKDPVGSEGLGVDTTDQPDAPDDGRSGAGAGPSAPGRPWQPGGLADGWPGAPRGSG